MKQPSRLRVGAAFVAASASFASGCKGAANHPIVGSGAHAASDASTSPSAPEAGVEADGGVVADAARPVAHDPSTYTPDQLLAEQIDPESQRGACAEAYRTLQLSFDRLLADQKKRVAGMVVPRAPSSFAAGVVDVAARAVIGNLPRHICRETAGGTWALLYDDFRGVLAEEMSPPRIAERAAPLDDEEAARPDAYPLYRVRATGRLVFHPAGSSASRETTFSLRHAPLLSLETLDDGFLAEASTVGDLEAGDVDGDGVPEVLVIGRTGNLPLMEGGDTRAHVTALYRGTNDRGIVLDTRAPANVAFDHLVDGDGDGLFDLVSPLPFFGLDEGNVSDIELQGPELLFHARPGGGFSRTDPAALAFARKSCPARPRGLPSPPPVAAGDERPARIYFTDAGDQAIHDVACARLWGVPESTVRAWVEAVNGGPELTRWAALSPPLQLSP